MKPVSISLFCLLVLSLVISACGTGQASGPTIPPSPTSTATPTDTPLPTGTPTSTSVPTQTLTPSPAPVPAAILGNWKNEDLNTQGITKINIQYADGTFSEGIWNKCEPTDCDYFNPRYHATIKVISYSETTLLLKYDSDFSQDTLDIRILTDGRLKITTHSQSKVHKPDSDNIYYFIKTSG